MKKQLFKLFAFLLVLALANACSDSLVTDDSENLELKSAGSAKKSYIVVLQDADVDLELSKVKGYEKKQVAMKSATDRILKRAGITDSEVSHVYGNALKGFSVMIPPGQLKKLEADPSVKYIEEDQVAVLIHPTKGKPGGGGGGTTGQSTPWGITRVGGAGNGTGKTAWIIDSGIDQDHPDLNVDTNRSASFLSGNEATNPDDQNGHGTHVAGTIAAVNNNIGVIGVAAGATVVAVRVLDRRGSGSYSGVIAGVDYVGANSQQGDVANMSLGGPVSAALDQAVVNAAQSSGVKFALAAGNDGDDANNHSPARANGNNVYTISAMNSSDVMPSWSNWGNPPVDYCSPGVSIQSTWKDGGYNTISGTSMATPHAAGVLLLGTAHTDGTVSGDPDGNPDPIIHR
ncbi:S8 family serine peptidase [Maribellus sp. YY47]|uniref:S8 family serine peptidase n=1 Tax=Maribellus sp. YY47 TaxID=2929486 RepID=UPI0020018ECD|nr:S8 family serine peptidase [Maribellus sp. YY47]MCK3685478.1 S8 family serine peptidase [Maribellus sp. YY47]